MSDRPMARVVHPDRQGLPRWLYLSLVASVAIAFAAGGSIAATSNGRPASQGILAGIVVTALAAWGLPSVSLRLVARIALLTSGSAVARFATVGPELENGTQTILLWMLAAVAALVLASRLDHHAVPAAEPSNPGDRRAASGAAPRIGADGGSERVPGDGLAGGSRHGSHDDGTAPVRGGRTAAHVVLIAALVVVVVTVLAPFAVSRAGSASASGRGPTSPPAEGSSLLRSSDSLDMTTRPELTDDVVLTVRSDSDLFLRGDLYDVWDGRRWSKSWTEVYSLLGGEQVMPSPIDLGAGGGDIVEQRIRVEAGYSDVFFAAPTAVHIQSRLGVVQTLDGSLFTRRGAMGQGETYTVTSRRIPLNEELLQMVEGNPFPQSVIRTYADEPVTTDRVRALADQIVEESGATTTYDRVRAIEDWMDDNLEYSIDAPTAPEGSDVVDDFLFRAKLGWCEQIASSLVVMARTQGIPARLATGYVMNERDSVTGTYVVRARDAHAWAEVWFPEVGWVPFDPTAGVPLAPGSPADDTFADWLLQHLVEVLVGGAVLVVLAVAGRRALVRLLARRRDQPHTWVAVADRRLTDLGERAGLSREPGDTATAFARRLAAARPPDGRQGSPGPDGSSDGRGGPRLPDLVPVGQVIDDHLYAPEPPPPERLAMADALLTEAESPPTD